MYILTLFMHTTKQLWKRSYIAYGLLRIGYHSYNEEAATVFNVHAPLSSAQRGGERDSMDAVASALYRGIAVASALCHPSHGYTHGYMEL